MGIVTVEGIIVRLMIILILDSEGKVPNITSQDVMFCHIRRRCILLVVVHCIERILEIFDETKVM